MLNSNDTRKNNGEWRISCFKRDRGNMEMDPILLKIVAVGVRKLARSCVKFAKEARGFWSDLLKLQR